MPEDVYRLIAEGLLPPRREFLDGSGIVDSLLLARMADENRLSYELENLLAAVAPGGVDTWKAPTRDKDPFKWTADERIARCRLDAWATLEVARRMAPLVPAELYEFTARTAAVLYRLHLAGAVVDMTRYRIVAERVEAETRKIEDRLRKAAIAAGMTAFAPSNDHHIRELLFERLGLPVLATTVKTKDPTVARKVLSELLELNGLGTEAAEILGYLIEHSAIDKFRGTYAEGLRELIRPCGALADGTEIGWLPFNFNPLVRTGRRSSRNPNSQNWPTEARRIIRSRWIGGKIAAFDFSRLEPCIIAWLAGDDELLHLFLDGNGYLKIAEELWGRKIEEGTPLYRGAKSIILGVHYDMGTDLMAEELWVKGIRFGSWPQHYAETDRARTRYLGRFPKLGLYMDRQRAERAETDQIVIPSGRIRHLPGRGKHLDNQAINSPVQGTASDIAASALLDTEAALLSEYGLSLGEWVGMLWEQRQRFLAGPGFGPVSVPWQVPVLFNEVHDELTGDLPPGHEKRVEELVIETMQAVPTFRKMVPSFDIPLRVGVKTRERWHGSK
jgi:DNA polymerase I-like protein with 3'-5' exonuclease and polymerase domains